MNTLKVEIVVHDLVKWIAVDKDGEVYGYSLKPIKGGDYWLGEFCSVKKLLYKGKPPKNWKDELYQWV